MLGLREIRRRRVQFALIGVVIALISYLVLMVNGLGTGLNDRAGSALRGLDADALAYAANADLSVIRSELSEARVVQIGADLVPATAAPLGYFGINTRTTSGRIESAALLGVRPDTIAAPVAREGRALTADDRRALLADLGFLRAAGVDIGDEIALIARGREETYRIVGAVDEGSFFFQPTVYVLLDSLRELKYGRIDATTPLASVVLLQADGIPASATAAYDVVDLDTAFANIEGVAGQQATVNALRFFGYLIGALVIGIFFYVLTLQKIAQTGLLKAIGASSGYVFRQLLLQVMVVSTAGVAIAIPLAVLTERLLARSPDGVPIAFRTSDYLLTAVLLVVMGLVGAAFSLRQITRLDPIIALGRQE